MACALTSFRSQRGGVPTHECGRKKGVRRVERHSEFSTGGHRFTLEGFQKSERGGFIEGSVFVLEALDGGEQFFGALPI